MRRSAAAVALAVALSGCGLPLPGGVQTPRALPEDQPRAEDVVVLPPGPAAGASARDVVEDFLRAQSSPQDDHAVARRFLTPELSRTWRDDAGVEVYDDLRPPSVTQTSDPEIVRVTARRVAAVGQDGVYRRDGEPLVEDYRVRCVDGTCRIAALEPGLRLSRSDLAGSFVPRAVHFLAPQTTGAPGSSHLVVDRVWLPVTRPAEGLVQAVLDGPSSALAGSVRTAVPPGTALAAPVASRADGTVTVDLTGQVRGLDDLRLQQLSAQLVWTLRALGTGFTRLRLRVEGRRLEVPGTATAQAATEWPGYDPERLRRGVPALYVQDRRLRSLGDDGLPRSEATDGTLPVDVVATRPDGGLALLTRLRGGGTEVRTGPQRGPFGPARAVGALSSPSWGGGERGLFLVRAGSLVLLRGEGPPVPLPVDTDGRPVRQVRVSRDGVRVAVLVGDADEPDLLVGRLVDDAGGLRVDALREIVPTLGRVTDLAWETSQTLVVLATFPALGVLPGRVVVDGSSALPLSTRLPQRVVPLSLAAAADRPLVLAMRRVEDPEAPQELYREDGQTFAPQGPGSGPTYPG